MGTYYSPSQNVAYPEELMVAYKAAETIPDDLIEISDEAFMEYFISLSPLGKYRKAGKDGHPVWANVAPVTKEAIAAEAANRQQNLLADAARVIAPLQDAVELGIATDEESQRYSAWRKYRVLLSRVNTNTTPEAEWPQRPE